MSDRPNVIVCLSDQLRAFATGCYGDPVIRTPNIDRLAREGMRFETAISNTPLCTPARSAFLSGQHPRTCVGDLGNVAFEPPDTSRSRLPDPSIAECFTSLGYRTAQIGKWHVYTDPHVLGFEETLSLRGLSFRRGQTPYSRNGGPEFFAEDRWSTEYEIDTAVDYVRDNRKSPFFLFLNLNPPHMPLCDMPRRFHTMYDPADVPLRPNVWQDGELPYNEPWFQIYRCVAAMDDPLPAGFTLRHLIALYYGMTTWMDAEMGRLLDALDDDGLTDNTIVVFLSDHGDHLGSHGLFNKNFLFEEATRIPLLLRWPGHIPPSVNTTQVAQIIDIMPTLLALCGGAIPPSVQGRDLSDVVGGRTESIHPNEVFIESLPGLVGIRTLTHLYGMQLEADRRTVKNDRYCFYDLRSDPYQLDDLTDSGEQTDHAEALRHRLLAWHERTPWLDVPPDPRMADLQREFHAFMDRAERSVTGEG